MEIKRYSKLTSELIDRLKLFDRYKRIHTSMQSGINWFVGISTGTLIWFLSNFNNFKIDSSIIDKYSTLFIVVCLCISTLTLGGLRLMILTREFLMNTALDSIQNIPDKILLRDKNLNDAEISEKYDKKIKEYLEVWSEGHNLISKSIAYIKFGVVAYLIALLVIIQKFIKYIFIVY